MRAKDAARRERTFDLDQIRAERNKARSEGIKLGPARREWEKKHPGAKLTKDGRILYPIRWFGRSLPNGAAVRKVETGVDTANDLDHQRYSDEERMKEEWFSVEELDVHSDQEEDEKEDETVAEDFSDMDWEEAEEQDRIFRESMERHVAPDNDAESE